MSEKNTENVSALVDDELQDSELRLSLDQLARSPELRQKWQRYHLMSDALHANLSAADSSALQQRIWQALEQEPTVLAPQRQRRLPPLVKQAVGLAIAASVAAVAIISVQDNPIQSPDTGFTPQLAQAGGRTDHGLVQLTTTGGNRESTPQDLRERLNPYLVNHNEYSVSAGMHGVLPYARLVSHESAR